jgi:hypothetical protein
MATLTLANFGSVVMKIGMAAMYLRKSIYDKDSSDSQEIFNGYSAFYG